MFRKTGVSRACRVCSAQGRLAAKSKPAATE
jgi:hypothetical protein